MLTKDYFTAILFFIIVTAGYYSTSSLMPKIKSDTSTSSTEFSIKRALDNLQEITQKPHYVGTPEHKIVQNYIVNKLQQLGLKPEIQNQLVINKKYHSSAYTQNIVAKIEGTADGKALLLVTHYDSSPHSSLGASDAGSGVVTILEGVRAFLATDIQPENDIIILISDAEEIGLLGASAFVKHHRWANNVGLVINFEARGTGGPSYMLMETNGGNKELIQHFRKANPEYPVATSLMYSIYKMLPNDTDLTIFREDSDIEGYNFAFIDDHFDYHTAQDTFQRLDKRSLQHQAAYLVPLLGYFAAADLTNLKSDKDYVYFNMPVAGLVYYPYEWVLPVFLLVLLLFTSLIFYGLSQEKISVRHLLKGFIPFILSLLISGLLAFFGWRLLLKLHPQYNELQQGFTYNGHLYIAAFSALSLAVTFLVYSTYLKKIKTTDLIIAPTFIWILINAAVLIYLKGAGYFIIAALSGLSSLAIYLLSNYGRKSNKLALTVLSIPVLLLFVPMIQMFPVGLGLKALVISTSIIVLLFGLLIPVFSDYSGTKTLGKLFLSLAIILLISASLMSGYNEDRKKPNSIIYVLDADKNEAYWASYDSEVDEFTRQFLGNNPATGSIDISTLTSKYNSKVKFHRKAEVKKIAQPVIEIISDTMIDSGRVVQLSITPQRKANILELISNTAIHFRSFKVNGEELSEKDENGFVLVNKINTSLLRHYLSGNEESLDLEFSIPENDSLKLTLYETSYDLLDSPMFNIEPRDETMMPKPFIINDAIIIKKKIALVLDEN
ncbi:MAG: M28 family peptidase [Pseudomonadota bacterium]|nr:M28 family peptidase [Pseudomonadota bacterium]